MTKIEKGNTDYIIILIMLGWFCYFIAYMGRLSYSACMIQIIKDLSITKEAAGLVLSIFYFSYGCGQFIYGIIIQKINPKKVITFVLIASALINIIVPFGTDIKSIQVLWFFNGAVQSALWAGIIRLFTTYIPEDRMYRAIVTIHTTGAAGTLFVYGLSSLSIALVNWQVMFFFVGFLLVAMGIVWYFGMSKIEKNLNSLNIPKVSDLRKQEDNKKNLDFLKLLVKSGAIVIILAAIANGIFRDGITLWTPSFLHERFGSGVAISVLSTLILPCFAIAGPVFAHAVNRHITNPLYATSIFFFLSLAAAFGVTILAKSYLLATVFFGIITCSMSAVNTLIVSVIPLSFRSFSNMSASLAGLTNAFCYIGSTSASYAFGAIARYYDWDGVLYALLIIAVIVAFLCIIGGLQYHKVFFGLAKRKCKNYSYDKYNYNVKRAVIR